MSYIPPKNKSMKVGSWWGDLLTTITKGAESGIVAGINQATASIIPPQPAVVPTTAVATTYQTVGVKESLVKYAPYALVGLAGVLAVRYLFSRD